MSAVTPEELFRMPDGYEGIHFGYIMALRKALAAG